MTNTQENGAVDPASQYPQSPQGAFPQYGQPQYGQSQPYAQQPYTQPYGQPPIPPQQPAKKKRKWPWVVGGIVVVLIIIGALSGGGSGDKKDATASSTTAAKSTVGAAAPATKQDEAAKGLNTPVRDGKFEFVVTGVEPGQDSVGDNPYLAQKAQGQFVVVSMTVKNIGNKPQDFAPSNQKLFDAQGRSFEPDNMAQIALGGSDMPVWDNINPGNTVNVKVVYDMPKDATPASIELHDSMFSGGEKVSLK